MSYFSRKALCAVISLCVLAACLGSAVAAETEEPIDMNQVRQLRKKQRDGEELTAEEKAYIERARASRGGNKTRPKREREGDGGGRPGGNAAGNGRGESTGMIPLTDLGEGDYQGQKGGLYGDGSNEPPDAHRKLAEKALAGIKPLNAEGKPAADGKIGVISIGMSNTTYEFGAFKKIADPDPDKSPAVVLVNGAEGGKEAHDWAHPDEQRMPGKPEPWGLLDRKLGKEKVSAEQIQVAWVKVAQAMPRDLGAFPKHAEVLRDNMETICRMLKQRFPNMKVIYLSSRIYAGYTTKALNPEPESYESAFSVRWVIEKQMKGDAGLNADPSKGKVVAPVLLWGPYMWADGLKGRKTDDLIWKREDLAGDGTHPSESGKTKVAEMLLNFLKTDPLAKGWFLK